MNENQTNDKFVMAVYIFLENGRDFDYSNFCKFDEIPLVLIENFQQNCSVEEIFLYFFDKIDLLEIYMKVNPDDKLIEKLIDFIEIYEKEELESTLSEKINSKKNTILMFKNERLKLHQKLEGFSIEHWTNEVKKRPTFNQRST